MISAKIIADSVGPNGVRLTTVEMTYPRYIHSEVMTYKKHSKNAASSRAIPVKKTLKRVWNNPAMPVWWGENEPGMQARAELRGWRKWLAIKLWILSSKIDVIFAWMLMKIGLHKQVANRVLEPAMWMTSIITSDHYGWANMLRQRDHGDAQPEYAELARLFRIAYTSSIPRRLQAGEWHLPYIEYGDWAEATEMVAKTDPNAVISMFRDPRVVDILKKVSTGRCARVSYLNHDGSRSLSADIKLHDKMKDADPGHWSPFEHPCMAVDPGTPVPPSNVVGWVQYRKTFPQEFLFELSDVSRV